MKEINFVMFSIFNIISNTFAIGLGSLRVPKTNNRVTNNLGIPSSQDGRLDFVGLAKKYGFPNTEEKEVITEDGYILTLYHIPGDVNRLILLAHGNTVDSCCWVTRGKKSLAFILATKGYDVWVINFRGTTISRRNLYLDADTQAEKFFNFTFYEQGYYDLPATIDFILKETNQKQLLVVAHSIGTANFLVLGSTKPEYNNKIKAFMSLAPISFVQHIRGLASLGALFGELLISLGLMLDFPEVFGKKQVIAGIANSTCMGPQGYPMCVEGFIFPLFGFDYKGFEKEYVPTFFGHFPEGSSMKLFSHLLQIMKKNRFARFDYGLKGNLVEYGMEEPPTFDLSKMTMKTAIFVGREDYLSSVPDAERLRDALPNVIHYQVMPYCRFNHFDFVWGLNMPTDLYPYLLPLIEKYI